MELVRTVLGAPFAARTWRDTAFLLIGVLTGALGFGVSVAFWSFGPLVALTILGWPLLLGAFYVIRGVAELDRRRAALVLGEPLVGRYRRPRDGRFLSRLGTAARDPRTWADTFWLLLSGPIGLATSVVTMTAWVCGIGGLTIPVWWWAVPVGSRPDVDPFGFAVDDWARAAYAALIGLGIVLVTPWLLRALTIVVAWLLRVLLTPGKRAVLEERVSELTETRSGALNVQAEELQRIERDLHDGAQARLVALAMDLGLAREKLDEEPEEARALVATAHEEAKTALRELRDLVRGIHPSILTDRGLDPALSALAARSPVPVALTVAVEGRLPAAVEAAAYFVVNEALVNVAKHAGASRCDVQVTHDGGAVHILVSDDGRGGADPVRGTGLQGLELRLRALDGRLEVESPPGGPTTLRAQIPCAS